MRRDGFGAKKTYVDVGYARVAYHEAGAVRLEALPGAGHLVMEERPERFAACVLEFLSEAVVDRRGGA